MKKKTKEQKIDVPLPSDVVLTVKRRGKSGRFKKAYSFTLADYVSEMNRLSADEIKLRWFDRLFRTERYFNYVAAVAYNQGSIEQRVECGMVLMEKVIDDNKKDN